MAVAELLALLRTVRLEPTADAPRLVLADWLDEHDQSARAEFIRLQCALAQPAHTHDEARRQALRADRANQLLEQHQRTWLGALAPLAEACTFHRGLIHLAVQPSQASALAARLELPDGPDVAWVERLALETDASVAVGAALGQSALLPWLVELVLRAPGRRQDADVLLPLLTSPHLAQLRRLSLVAMSLQPTHWTDLAQNPAVQQLRALDLSYNLAPVDALAAIAQSPYLRQLTSVQLNGIGPLRADGATVLAEAHWRTTVTTLELRWNEMGTAAVRALCTRGWPQLHTWSLDGTRVGNVASWCISEFGKLPKLHTIRLRASDLDDDGVDTLLRSPYLGQWRELGLAFNPNVRDPAARRFIDEREALDRLTLLDLRNTSISKPLRTRLWGRYRDLVLLSE
jgi:uncharacterized protein (TIGR02996 family)